MRPAPRLYINEHLGANSIALSQEQSRYLGQVLRLKEGDAVRVFNARDGEWLYQLTAIGKHGAEASAGHQRRRQETVPDTPILYFAPIKRTPMEVLVQKATELGVSALQPVITARTNRGHLRIDRLQSIAVEAAEQSERLSVPTIHPPITLQDLVNDSPRFVFCDEAGDVPNEPWGGEQGRAPLAGPVFQDHTRIPRGVLIGPEGGFTPDERSGLRVCRAALPVSLGPRILRAETAAIVALTLWQVFYGDLSSISS
ncbi:MAG: 16S rRNA (uracil(1498)-N(3))-methyltransferase [Pseudomonadota bacterium]